VHRILVFTRSASLTAEDQAISCAGFHELMDEFVCFENALTYHTGYARPEFAPGAIPVVLAGVLADLNRKAGVDKPIFRAPDWDGAEAVLRDRLKDRRGRTLVLINQPSTAEHLLNRHIVELARRPVELGLVEEGADLAVQPDRRIASQPRRRKRRL
jgi:hypothetical protein